jgi:hypothetical protein
VANRTFSETRLRGSFICFSWAGTAGPFPMAPI